MKKLDLSNRFIKISRMLLTGLACAIAALTVEKSASAIALPFLTAVAVSSLLLSSPLAKRWLTYVTTLLILILPTISLEVFSDLSSAKFAWSDIHKSFALSFYGLVFFWPYTLTTISLFLTFDFWLSYKPKSSKYRDDKL